MEGFLGVCKSFTTFLWCEGREEMRTNFPRKQAIIFAAEAVEAWDEVTRCWTQDDATISRCSRLLFALTVLADSCKGTHGIAAFSEVLQIFVELCAQIKQQNESVNALMDHARIFPATIATLKSELGSMSSEMDEQGKTAGVQASATEAAGAISDTSLNPLIDQFRSLGAMDGSHDVVGRKLELMRHLICKGVLQFVKSVRRTKLSDHQEVVTIFHTESNRADLSAELDSLKMFLGRVQVVTKVYTEPLEL